MPQANRHPKSPLRKAALYARVSTHEQDTENQLTELRAVAERAGWLITGEYVDNGISGAKGRQHRPAFNDLCKTITRRQVDVVVCWSVDRLSRSLKDLVEFLNDLHASGVDLYLHKQGIDTTTPGGKALFQMLGVFAEFEREIIRERVNAGLSRAKMHGTKSGKSIGRPKVSQETEKAILAAHQAGAGQLRISRNLGVGVSTVRRVLGLTMQS